MTNEVTQIITRWQGHPVHGVNALAGKIPRADVNGGDDWPAPPTMYLFDDLMGDVVNDQLELEPPATPCLLNFCQSDIRFDNPKEQRAISRQITIASAYCTQDMPTDVAVRNGGLSLRALVQCYERFNHQTLSDGYRELNGVRVQKVSDISVTRVAGAVGRSKMWGIALCTLIAIDKQV